jgi:hypothetical protein
MAVMNEHAHEMLTSLCTRIVDETNPVIFRQLLIELDALLEKLNNNRGKRSGFEDEKSSSDLHQT